MEVETPALRSRGLAQLWSTSAKIQLLLQVHWKFQQSCNQILMLIVHSKITHTCVAHCFRTWGRQIVCQIWDVDTHGTYGFSLLIIQLFVLCGTYILQVCSWQMILMYIYSRLYARNEVCVPFPPYRDTTILFSKVNSAGIEQYASIYVVPPVQPPWPFKVWVSALWQHHLCSSNSSTNACIFVWPKAILWSSFLV